LYDHGWDEFRFRHFYPNIDADDLTELEFEDALYLMPVIHLWLKGKDVSDRLAMRTAEREFAYREAFGKGSFVEDPDELGG
jgi:hypothetical protein